MKQGMGSHQSTKMLNDEWITPKHIFNGLGHFDLDPCAPLNPPYKIADVHYSKEENGLIKNWFGRVWLNPPYGNETAKWLNKLSVHQNGIALIFARTETKMFFEHVWNKAKAIKFIEGRLFFHYVDGTKAKSNSGAPSVLIAYDYYNAGILIDSEIPGKLIFLNNK